MTIYTHANLAGLGGWDSLPGINDPEDPVFVSQFISLLHQFIDGIGYTDAQIAAAIQRATWYGALGSGSNPYAAAKEVADLLGATTPGVVDMSQVQAYNQAAVERSPEGQARAADTGGFLDSAIGLIALGAAVYFGVPELFTEVAASAGVSSVAANAAWEAELAAGWEGSAAVSAMQNAAIAEVTGAVVPGTLAETIGAEAASAALADAASTVGAGATAAEAASEFTGDIPTAENTPDYEPPSPDPQTPPKDVIDTKTTTPPPEVPKTPANADLLQKIFKAGTALYQYAVKRNAAGQPLLNSSGQQLLAPRQVGQVSLNGQPVYFSDSATTVPTWAIGAAAAIAIAFVASRR